MIPVRRFGSCTPPGRYVAQARKLPAGSGECAHEHYYICNSFQCALLVNGQPPCADLDEFIRQGSILRVIEYPWL